MNMLDTANTNNEDILKTQMELEAPLLEKGGSDCETMALEIHSAIPITEPTWGFYKAVITDNDDTHTSILDGNCNIFNQFYYCGILLGVMFQSCALYIVSVVMPAKVGATPTPTPVIFALYFISRYWLVIALLLHPIFFVTYAKVCGKRKRTRPIAIWSFLECVRFQLGLFSGSLILLSLTSCYALANSTSIFLLATYYAVCSVLSFFALRLLQTFLNQVCVNISSIEIVVNYEQDNDSDDDDDDEHEHEC